MYLEKITRIPFTILLGNHPFGLGSLISDTPWRQFENPASNNKPSILDMAQLESTTLGGFTCDFQASRLHSADQQRIT